MARLLKASVVNQPPWRADLIVRAGSYLLFGGNRFCTFSSTGAQKYAMSSQTHVNTTLKFSTRYAFLKFKTQTVNKPFTYNNKHPLSRRLSHILAYSTRYIKLFIAATICVKQAQNRGIWGRIGPSMWLASSDNQIDKPECGCPKRTELFFKQIVEFPNKMIQLHYFYA